MVVKNVVLVHGGFVDGSGWQGVYKALKKSGYSVTVVQNPTFSLADDVSVTKRALATFGNPFGLALYDKDQAHVTKPAARPDPPPLGASPAASKGPGRGNLHF